MPWFSLYRESVPCNCRDFWLRYQEHRGVPLPRKRAAQMPWSRVTVPWPTVSELYAEDRCRPGGPSREGSNPPPAYILYIYLWFSSIFFKYNMISTQYVTHPLNVTSARTLWFDRLSYLCDTWYLSCIGWFVWIWPGMLPGLVYFLDCKSLCFEWVGQLLFGCWFWWIAAPFSGGFVAPESLERLRVLYLSIYILYWYYTRLIFSISFCCQ